MWLGSKLTWWKEMEVSGSHGGAKQQQRVFVVVGSCRESLGAIGSHWESLGAVGVNFPTNVPRVLLRVPRRVPGEWNIHGSNLDIRQH